ncbi:MAG: hypothetical protein GY757_04950 [bacterium]|nr:hypothetical protein [bacterium]
MMIKSVLKLALILSVVWLLLFSTACKKAKLEYSSYLLDGNGTYSAADNTTTISLRCTIELVQPNILKEALQASLVDWAFELKQGDVSVLNVNDKNYFNALGPVFLRTSSLEDQYLFVMVESSVPIEGDLFSGNTPDTIIFYGWLEDENGNLAQVVYTGSFSATRE